MISLFIIPVLLCGIIWIKINPNQKAMISAYQGWVIYLYATFYGVVALSVSWLVLEYLVPFLFGNYEKYINYFLYEAGVSIKVSEDYLDRLASYVIYRPPVEMPENEIYSYFITARVMVISAFSVIFTFIVSVLIFFLKSGKKSKLKRVLRIYEHDSPTDYQLLLIGARYVENKNKVDNLRTTRDINCKLNRKVKKLLRFFKTYRRLKRFFYFLHALDYGGLKNIIRGKNNRKWLRETEDYFNREVLYFYKDVLRGQKKRLERLKVKVSNEPLYAQVTLDSRKLYIGVPKQIGLPNEKSIGNEEVSLLPVYSGYRVAEDMSIAITNKYTLLEDDFYTDINNVVIKKDKISSVSAFSMRYYKIIQGFGDNKKLSCMRRSVNKFNRTIY